MKKLFKKIGASLAEGALQSVPMGNAIYKIVVFLLTKLGVIKSEDNKVAPNWPALIIETILVIAIVYSFITKAITLDELIEYMNQFA